MSLSELFVRHLGYRFWLAYKGESAILKYYRGFLPLWNADDETLSVLKVDSLRAIVRHAVATSEYYQSIFNRAGFDPQSVRKCEDVRALPLLSKNDLIRDMDRILSSSYRREDLISSTTGGSIGLPLTFYRDRRATSIRRAQDYFFNAKLGIHAGTKRAWIWGSPLDVFRLHTLKAKITNFLTERAIRFYSDDATWSGMDVFIKRLNRHRPEVVIAYPNMLSVFAEYVQQKGIAVAPIPKVIVTAEPLYDWQRQLFKAIFGAETFERYGSRETGTIASEGFEHNGMHIFEPCYHIEVLDEDGREVREGEMGELVITDFHNYAMPLIRYRTGDMVRIDSKPCPCGSSWRRIIAVGGRIVDLILRPDGSRISGTAIIAALRGSGVWVQVQVVQTSVNSIIVKHLKEDEIAPDVRATFQQTINRVFGTDVTITYQPVDELKHDKSGKYRYVISECGKGVHAVDR